MPLRIGILISLLAGLLFVSTTVSSERFRQNKDAGNSENQNSDYVCEARQIVRAHIVARSLMRYERDRERASANDTTLWKDHWITDAGIILTDSCLYPSLDSLVVIKTAETGSYDYDSDWSIIKVSCWGPDPTWFVGFVRNGGSYVLNGEEPEMWGSELSDLLEHLRKQPQSETFLQELTQLYADLYLWDKEWLSFRRVRQVSNFAQVRDFWQYEDSVIFSQMDPEELAEHDSSGWGYEEYQRFVKDTSSIEVQLSIHPPVVEKTDGGHVVTIFVVTDADQSVRKLVGKISADLTFELISLEKII